MEHVDARALRRARDERALRVEAAGARSRQVDQVRQRPRAALLGQAEEHEQDLRGRAGVGERPVARRGRDAEEVREGREADAAVLPSSRRRASHTVSTTGAAIRLPVRRSTSRSRNARSKRALCATRAASPANPTKRRTAGRDAAARRAGRAGGSR